MENLGKFSLIIIMIVVGFLISLLSVTVIISIANLYDIKMITSLSFIQLYGILTIIYIVTYRKVKVKENEKKEDMDVMSDFFIDIFGKAIFILLSWGFAFITYNILT